MKIELYYRNCHLGSLSFEDSKFVYNSDLNGEEEYNNISVLKYEYTLHGSKNLASKNIFKEFLLFLKACDRADFIRMANIKPKDDMFTKLYKLASVETDKDGYYITH